MKGKRTLFLIVVSIISVCVLIGLWKGYDPLYFNPQDPWGRPMNQPRIVQHIVSILKINQGHTTIIGILFILLFFIGIFISLKRIDNLTALILTAVIMEK